MHETLGQVIWIAVKPIIKIYLIIGVGFGLCKMGILTADATRSISDIVLTVLLPSLSFNKIVGNIEDQDIKFVGIICLTSILIFATGLGCAYIIKKTLPVPKAWGGGILAGGMFPNISDLPIAYLQTLDQSGMFTTEEGNKGVANVIIFLAMFLFCVFNLGGFRLIENDFNYKDEESGVRDSERSSIASPLASIPEEGEFQASNNNDMSSSSSSLSGKSHSVVNGEKNGFNSSSETPSELNHDQEKNMVTKLGAGNSSSSFNQNLENSTTEDLGDMPMASGNNNDLQSVQSSIATSVDSHGSAGDYNRELGIPAARRTMSQPVAFTEEDNGSLGRRQTYSQYSLNSELALTPVRSLDKRDFPAEDMNDIVREYSNVDQYGQRRASVVALQNEDPSNDQASHTSSLQRIKSSNLTKILTSDATVSKKDIEESGSSLPKCIQKFPLTPFIVFFLKNCLRPCSMAVIVALTIAFIPWVKALFVTSNNTPHIKQAPDEQPALSFFMDFTSYVGAASVPFGLILLGATLGRLKIQKLYPGFWKSAVLLVFLKQCIMPIFGVLWADRLVKAGWLDREKDEMLLFVMTINWALPTMTTLIYFTASYTPLDCEDPIQMECTAFFLMLQYPLLVISLPFVVTYYLKVYLKK
ncbi:similar to Saccharomyces cerevisiae YOR092W ECM3 Non-essential protein of unknown function [Maudiozyma barnettii]|uniref:Protein ECM3 n=1 Tax=Maudiozyma barnettii TaxID=61262 RepID=A0A8H2VFK0_9SACH|nr:putative ATPase ECM3 [Kazachstania barnettii]CAB4254234.1 similar to Saccharomyces cerevisiae YOR092W ECM3 Non-essential protein of unknown function [Kazachstania barnettii]CAD1781979.1 similar to Saccharomyces cerevisiae YOR092W ECM3 Non-essential protein of unknown function [Kazachstania barnettii]